MNLFIKIRNLLREFASNHEVLVDRIFNGLICFFCLMIVNEEFGYATLLNHTWVAVVLAIVCAFLPLNGGSAVIAVVLLLHLNALSTEVMLTALILMALSYFVCSFYQVRRKRNIIFIGVFQQIGIPYVVSMETGLLGGINEVASIVTGGFVSFFLRVIRDNSSLFLDETASVSTTDVIINQMLGNAFFYFYLVALVAMFIVIYFIRERGTKNVWIFATLFGTLTEFIILLAGYLFTENQSRVGSLIIGSLVVYIIGATISFLFKNYDYSRVEKTQFEDDDYYYYVTAVPKVRLSQEELTVKKITDAMDTEERE